MYNSTEYLNLLNKDIYIYFIYRYKYMGNTSSHQSNAELLSDTNKKLQGAGVSQDILDEITKSIDNRFICDDECKRQREIVELKSKWKADKERYINLPEQINEAERAYYVEAKSDDYYNNNILRVRYNNIFQRFKDNKTKQLDNVARNVNKNIEHYTANKLAEKRIKELYNDSLKKNKALKLDIDNYYRKVFTDERKVYYEDEQLENLEYYHTLIMIIYFALIVLYILFGPFFKQQKYKSILTWFFIALYVAFPFLLNYLITIYGNIFKKI